MVNPSANPDPPLGCPDPPRGWLQFCVRFVFGVLLGAVAGTLMWLYLFPADAWGWLALPLASFVLAFAFALYGDTVFLYLRRIFTFLSW
jgi:hypothetical protein